MFSSNAGFVAVILNMAAVVLMALLAHNDGMLSPSQMLKKYPDYSVGLPLIAHGGIWSNLFLFSPLSGFIVGNHSAEWTKAQAFWVFMAGLALSWFMHAVYASMKLPDALAWKREGITTAGLVHFVYMTAAFTLIGLFYFCSEPSADALVAVSIALVIHVVIGNHVFLGWLNESTWHFPWCPDFIRKPDPWITIAAACVAVIGMTAWSGGFPPAFRVAIYLVGLWVFGGLCFIAAYFSPGAKPPQ